MSASSTCIIVSPYFPPSTVAGVHRTRLLAKHLPAAGWKPVIICVDETFHEEALDQELSKLIPSETEIIKVSAVPIRMTRPIGLGEISIRGWWTLRKAVIGRIKHAPVGAVLITGSPYFPMLLASMIRKRFGIPVVLDFQDPWVSAWGSKQPLLSRQGISHALATFLEPRAVRAASWITSVSDIQNAEMAKRYGWLDASRMSAIPIGGDPDDISKAPLTTMSTSGSERVTLSFVGTVGPEGIQVLISLLKAAAELEAGVPRRSSHVYI